MPPHAGPQNLTNQRGDTDPSMQPAKVWTTNLGRHPFGHPTNNEFYAIQGPCQCEGKG